MSKEFQRRLQMAKEEQSKIQHQRKLNEKERSKQKKELSRQKRQRQTQYEHQRQTILDQAELCLRTHPLFHQITRALHNQELHSAITLIHRLNWPLRQEKPSWLDMVGNHFLGYRPKITINQPSIFKLSFPIPKSLDANEDPLFQTDPADLAKQALRTDSYIQAAGGGRYIMKKSTSWDAWSGGDIVSYVPTFTRGKTHLFIIPDPTLQHLKFRFQSESFNSLEDTLDSIAHTIASEQ